MAALRATGISVRAEHQHPPLAEAGDDSRELMEEYLCEGDIE